jgi:GTP-binding protein
MKKDHGMAVRKAKFVQSASTFAGCPKPTLPEFALIGRSNVGKSSLINLICNNGNLAKVSATPGKTRLINHFLIDDKWYLVDLPGYGYAKAGKETREKFTTLIYDYCQNRETLRCLFVLLDSRLPLQQIDREFLMWCGENSIPVALLYTKADKNSKSELKRHIADIEKEILKFWEDMPNGFVTSAEKKTGRDEVLDFIEAHLQAGE